MQILLQAEGMQMVPQTAGMQVLPQATGMQIAPQSMSGCVQTVSCCRVTLGSTAEPGVWQRVVMLKRS